MNADFLGGVVEGFYGQPWTQAQRFKLFDQMVDWGLNTYFYAPKDDMKHRAIWRELYDDTELASVTELIRACDERKLRFIYGLSPGLNIRFSDSLELAAIQERFEQLIAHGARHFALLFDDLPGEISESDRQAFESVAEAQASVTNQVFHWLRAQFPDARMLFCPTPYCGRMDNARLGGEGYLETIGTSLDPDVDVFWTGPEIISAEISVDSIEQLTSRLQRPPLIWDNLHANDYDLRRLYCGPYSGRAPELKKHLRGILTNPNNEFPINFIPLRTLGAYLNNDRYEPREAYLESVAAWAEEYTSIGAPISVEDVTLLADCYYLPHQEGPAAESLIDLCQRLVRDDVSHWGDGEDQFCQLNARVQSMFESLTELKDRDLFYAWSRRAWELKEELDLFQTYLAKKKAGADGANGIKSPSHLPLTYRGGTVARLQRQLSMDDEGRFQP